MAAITVHYVTSLPGMLVANALHLVLSGTAAETYVTGADAVGRCVGNSALIDERIAAAGGGSGGQAAEIVDDIAARDVLFTGAENIQALVVDASADATVDSGSALYAYRGSVGAGWTCRSRILNSVRAEVTPERDLTDKADVGASPVSWHG